MKWKMGTNDYHGPGWPQRVAPLLKRCTRDGVTRDSLVKPVGRLFQTETCDAWNPKSESSGTDSGSDTKEAQSGFSSEEVGAHLANLTGNTDTISQVSLYNN